MAINPVYFNVEIIEGADKSVQCIHALRQVMDRFSGHGELSAGGKDRRAVYAWFVERYNMELILPPFKLTNK